MSSAYRKAHPAAKSVISDPEKVRKLLLKTLHIIAQAVGATLGPGGKVALIDRQDERLPPASTKDGVTVMRALGFDDSNMQMIMESVAAAAIRTSTEAGDGTTTATILADAIAKEIDAYCEANPKLSPQRVIRSLKQIVTTDVAREIKKHLIKADFFTPEGQSLLEKVANVSANGDTQLGKAVIECFNIVGDDGNVTITDEIASTSGFVVQKVEGYPLANGWLDSCEPYSAKFINDVGNQKVVIEKPLIMVNYGIIQSMAPFVNLFNVIGEMFKARKLPSGNLVIIATGFSDEAKIQLAGNFAHPESKIKVFPLVSPIPPVPEGVLGLMRDICVATGQRQLLDPAQKSYQEFILEDLGKARQVEVNRFRSNIYFDMDESKEFEVAAWVDTLRKQRQLGSEYERAFINERIGKLTGGIAELRVIGSTPGEIRERKDRADDAVCAVRGAIKHGCLPGGASVLTWLSGWLALEADPQVGAGARPEAVILEKAFKAPIVKLLTNQGYNNEEVGIVIGDYITMGVQGLDLRTVFDVVLGKWVNTTEVGLLDSAPAVTEAITNALSIASQLGSTGVLISFPRDDEFERSEARSVRQFIYDSETG